MAESTSEIQRCARVIGDGEFAFPVVGAVEHQADLDILAGGQSKEGALKLCAALLQPKPGNPKGKQVSVIVHSCAVGYLAANAEAAFLAALAVGGYANAACEAVIFGGRLYGEADGEFGIKLNVAVPFKLVDPVVQAPIPPPPRAAPPPRPVVRTPRWARAAEPPPAPPTPPASAPEPPSAPEPQPIVEPPALADEPAPPPHPEPPPPAEPEPAPHGPQTHIFRAAEHGRGFFGLIFLSALLVFNLAMAVWLFAFWTGLFELADAVLVGGEWEAKFRGMLGTELIVAIWIAGTVVLALLTYMTRGKKFVIEEIVESPDAPAA